MEALNLSKLPTDNEDILIVWILLLKCYFIVNLLYLVILINKINV